MTVGSANGTWRTNCSADSGIRAILLYSAWVPNSRAHKHFEATCETSYGTNPKTKKATYLVGTQYFTSFALQQCVCEWGHVLQMGAGLGPGNQVSIFSFLLRVINFLDKFSHVLRFTSSVFTPPTPFLFLQRTYDCILPECTFQGICRCWPVLTRFSQGFWTDVFGFSHFYKNREFCKFQLVFSFLFFSP